MPHHESPPMAQVVPLLATDGSAPPPSQDEINNLLNVILTAEKSQTSLDASYALCTLLVNSVGFRGLKGFGVLEFVFIRNVQACARGEVRPDLPNGGIEPDASHTARAVG